MDCSGIWLPIVTPFTDGAVDMASYERMLTEDFVTVYERMRRNDHHGARAAWARPECRLPLTRVSAALGAELDRTLQGLGQAAEPLVA